ncbi:DUF413 domain-containing protein [Zooshikella sp. RANM57]|uniref:DUF413 domain-containing protein n=1 Tax=Zooshikella sp. RANM57 TaxID=3425863 RepID=UPI003D6F99F1
MSTATLSQSFKTAKRFFDDAHFPYGFQRSGFFSIREANTLTSLGDALKSLSEGSREPLSEDEANFVRVVRGEAAPSTFVEKTWMKYLNKINMEDAYTAVYFDED